MRSSHNSANLMIVTLLAMLTFAPLSNAQDTGLQNDAELKTEQSDSNSNDSNDQSSSAGQSSSQQETEASATTETQKEAEADPIGSGSNERFIPTEEISEDLPVSFPVDI